MVVFFNLSETTTIYNSLHFNLNDPLCLTHDRRTGVGVGVGGAVDKRLGTGELATVKKNVDLV